MGIVRDIINQELRIYLDNGRVMRPLFVINPNVSNPQELLIRKKHIRRLQLDDNKDYLALKNDIKTF